MKITKRQLRRIIREVGSPDRVHSIDPLTGGDTEKQLEDVEVQEAIEELVSSPNTRVSFAPGSAEDEVYIMTGAAEGITVKVLRRGR